MVAILDFNELQAICERAPARHGAPGLAGEKRRQPHLDRERNARIFRILARQKTHICKPLYGFGDSLCAQTLGAPQLRFAQLGFSGARTSCTICRVVQSFSDVLSLVSIASRSHTSFWFSRGRQPATAPSRSARDSDRQENDGFLGQVRGSCHGELRNSRRSQRRISSADVCSCTGA